jgi:hypothetical protein
VRPTDPLPNHPVTFTESALGRAPIASLLRPVAASIGLLLASRVNAQTSTAITTPSNPSDTLERLEQVAVYCQLLGPAGMLGLGVSYRPIESLAIDLSLGGFALGDRLSGVAPAVGLAWLVGGAHNFELGATAATLFTDRDVDPVRMLFGPHIGYRYQPSGDHLFFRGTLHGVVVLSRELVVPWPGVAFGSTWDT